jgi:Dynein heavy chain, N-terminal region 1
LEPSTGLFAILLDVKTISALIIYYSPTPKAPCDCTTKKLFICDFLFSALPDNSVPATSAFKRARECVNLLQCWKSSYMETRRFIEDSGVGSRWEFDKKTLFGLVDHVTRISQDIADIAKVKNQARVRERESMSNFMPLQNEIIIESYLFSYPFPSTQTPGILRI